MEEVRKVIYPMSAHVFVKRARLPGLEGDSNPIARNPARGSYNIWFPNRFVNNPSPSVIAIDHVDPTALPLEVAFLHLAKRFCVLKGPARDLDLSHRDPPQLF